MHWQEQSASRASGCCWRASVGSESCIFHPTLISLSRRVLGFLKEQKFFNYKRRKCLNGTVNNNKLRDTRAAGAAGDHLLPTKSPLWQFEFMCGVKHSAIWNTSLHHRFSSHGKFHPAELERHQKDGLWCTKNWEFGGCPSVSWYHQPSLCAEL